MNPVLFSLSTVGPVFLIIAIGLVMRRLGLIDPELSGQLTRLVFNLFLPALLLHAMIGADFGALLSLRLIGTVWLTLFISFGIARLLAQFLIRDTDERGFFASGSTWGNVAIIGYALGEALYGSEGLARAAVFSAMVLPLHTPMGYLAMDRSLRAEKHEAFIPAMLRRIFTNPIILAIVLGLVLNLGLNLSDREMPVLIMDILEILAQASLPLALVAIGGSLEFGKDPAGLVEPLGASLVKLVIMPVLAFLGARIAGLDGPWTGSIVLGFACPTAVSFFVVSRGLGHEASRGAAVVTSTTIGAALTTALVAVFLSMAGLV